MREIVNGIFYVMRAGCPWRLLPSDLARWERFTAGSPNWRDDGSFERLNHALAMADRERVGRNRRLTEGFEATIDSARAFAYAASVTLLVHRIARAS